MTEPSLPAASDVGSTPSATTPSAPVGARGFLFSDLRGYTAFVERYGDRAAADLLATYRTLVRSAIAAFDGAEIRTEGDSFYVVFPSASAAVEAGLAIVSSAAEHSTPELPIRVGVGVHAGETVATTEGLVGGAVNIAARVCAKAQPGELLITETVRALTRTYLPYRYTSLGTQQLKGISGGIPLYRVEAGPSSGRARLSRQLGARRGRVAVVAGAIVVLVAVAAGGYAATRPAACLTLPAGTHDVVARIDPARNCVVATYPVGQRPGAIVATKDSIWVANIDDWTLSRIDLKTGKTIQTGLGGSPVDLAADSSGDVYGLTVDNKTPTDDPGAAKVAQVADRNSQIVVANSLPSAHVTVAPGGGGTFFSRYWAIALVGGRVWASDIAYGNLVRLHVEGTGGGARPESITINIEPPGTGPSGNPVGTAGTGPIVGGQGVVWVANTLEPRLYSIGGTSSKADTISLDDHGGTQAIDAAGSYVWLGRADNYLTRYDPGRSAMDSTDTGSPISAVSASEGTIWVAHGSGDTVTRVDPASNQITATVHVGGRPADVATAPDGSVWVTIQGT